MRDRIDGLRLADADRWKPRNARCQWGEPERANDDAYEHKAEHRTDAQTMEQWDDDGRGAEDDECRFVKREIKSSWLHLPTLTGGTTSEPCVGRAYAIKRIATDWLRGVRPQGKLLSWTAGPKGT